MRPRWETPLSAAPAAKWKVQKILYVPAASYDAYETAWTDVTSQGYALQDINDQQLTDGIYYRASRETDWVPTLPATFTALYVRTVGDDAAPYRQPVQYRHHQNLGTVRSRDTRSEHGEIRSHGVPDRIGRQRQTGHDQILRKYDLDRSRSLQRLHGPDQGDRSDRSRHYRRKHVRRVYGAGGSHPCRRVSKPSATKRSRVAPPLRMPTSPR